MHLFAKRHRPFFILEILCCTQQEINRPRERAMAMDRVFVVGPNNRYQKEKAKEEIRIRIRFAIEKRVAWDLMDEQATRDGQWTPDTTQQAQVERCQMLPGCALLIRCRTACTEYCVFRSCLVVYDA